MGVPREDLLLMVRALKRGFTDLKAIRKALRRSVSDPVPLLEGLRLPPAQAEALRADFSLPDVSRDRAVLDPLVEMLLEEEALTAGEWEKMAAAFGRPGERPSYAGLPVPREFDGYTLQWELARRERGVVYRARDARGGDVAIKVYRREVPTAEGLPRVEGHAYRVSAFVEGETLDERRPSPRRGAVAIEKAARILAGRPHGALTPGRIVLRRDDSVAVLGFEAARSAPLSARARVYTGEASAADPAKADLRALGAILYEILVGTPPAGEASPAARSREVDPQLDRVVSASLSGGYGSVQEFADDLARVLRGEPAAARVSPPAGAKRRRWPWAVAAAAALALGTGIFLAVPRGKGPLPPPPDASRAGPVRESPAPAAPAPAPAPAAPRREAAVPEVPPAPLTREDEDRLYSECVRALAEGDSERLVASASEAVARGSRRDWFHYQLAATHLSRRRLDMALGCVSRALELSPGNRDYLRTRAEVHALRGEAAKALADFEALYGRGAAELNRQIGDLSRQVKADASDAQARLLRGVFFLLKRHHESAAEDFTAAIDLGFRRALAWRSRAWREAGPGGRARADADARAFLAEFPGDPAGEELKALLRGAGPD